MYTSVSVHQFVYDDGQKSQILILSRMAMKTDKSVMHDQSNRLNNPPSLSSSLSELSSFFSSVSFGFSE